MIRVENSVSFAAKRTRRPQVVMIRIGSISELGWLPAKITGPRAGTCSRPTTSTWRKNTRMVRARNQRSAAYTTRRSYYSIGGGAPPAVLRSGNPGSARVTSSARAAKRAHSR